MIAAGYMLKFIAGRPEWLPAPQVREICSVSDCTSKAFADYTPLWRHNDFWLFDSMEVVDAVAADSGVDRSDARLFYYEAYEQELPWGGRREPDTTWRDLSLPGAFSVDVRPPREKHLLGFDVIAYGDQLPECSPLSCNSMAAELPTNEHCLFATLDEAKSAIDQDRFTDCEMGVYRIFAVYEVSDTRSA